MHVQPVLSEDGTDINSATSEQVSRVTEDDGDDSENEGLKDDNSTADAKQSAESSQMSKNLSYFLKYKKKRQYEQERKLPLMCQVLLIRK